MAIKEFQPTSHTEAGVGASGTGDIIDEIPEDSERERPVVEEARWRALALGKLQRGSLNARVAEAEDGVIEV